jgi:hypothetical protein
MLDTALQWIGLVEAESRWNGVSLTQFCEIMKCAAPVREQAPLEELTDAVSLSVAFLVLCAAFFLALFIAYLCRCC